MGGEEIPRQVATSPTSTSSHPWMEEVRGAVEERWTDAAMTTITFTFTLLAITFTAFILLRSGVWGR